MTGDSSSAMAALAVSKAGAVAPDAGTAGIEAAVPLPTGLPGPSGILAPQESPQAVPAEVPAAARPLSPDISREIEVRHAPPALTVDGVTVSFDGFKALDGITLVLETGELRCLIGPNGAGKTTLMDVITGKTRPDQGAVYLGNGGEDLTQLSEYEIAQLGVGRKFQRPTVFGGHTVFENMELALRGPKGLWKSLFARLNGEQKARIEQVLETIGLAGEQRTRAGVLSHGQKQWLEIGMLLVQDPKVMLVDEPVAGMTHQETEKTAELLASLAGERTVVVVEHDMDFVRTIARRVTVLHEGRVLSEGTMAHVQNDPAVIEVYLGS